jgi:DNA-binding MarR family transcriptional regulator
MSGSEEYKQLDNGITMNTLTDKLGCFSSVNPNMTANMMRAFMFVATRAPCTQSDLAKFLDTNGTTTSRIVSWWCSEELNRNKAKPMMLRRELKSDRRKKILKLTAEGEALFRHLQE